MSKIKIMPESLANQIAAGEVVERPASVVKELVENAIDAQARQIDIAIKEAGVISIQVTDDGIGMDQEDLVLAFAPHATSKIFNQEDLFSIYSLGFRGEALASIGSVAQVRVESKTEDSLTGHFIELAGSQVLDQGQAKARKGTSILVEKIFYNTPARLKHLRSMNTELRHILNFVQDIALAFPQIRFKLVSDDQIIFQSIGNGDLQQAIASVYQPKLARQLIKFEGQDNNFSLTGYISPASLTRTNKSYIHWIINGRVVKSRSLTEVLVRAYGRQLMVGRYPIAIIHIDLDPRLVDVNVHPTKQTVRLSLEEDLAQLIRQAVQTALGQSQPYPSVEDNQVKLPLTHPDPGPALSIQQDQFNFNYDRPKFVDQEETIEASVNDYIKEDYYPSDDFSQVLHPDNYQQDLSQVSPRPKFDFLALDYIGQIHGTYLVASGQDGFYLIDQHAAQEKIRYEHFMETEFQLDQQILLMPELLKLTLSQDQAIRMNQERLASLGISLDPFGPQVWQLQSYPTWMDEDDLSKQVLDISEFIDRKPDASISDIIEASLIMRSCRGAIKANHRLDQSQAQALIKDLAQLKDPFHCPHGRPVLVHISDKQIEKWFKRIQDSHTSQFDAQF